MRDQLGGLQETLQNFTQTSRSDPGQFQRLKTLRPNVEKKEIVRNSSLLKKKCSL